MTDLVTLPWEVVIAVVGGFLTLILGVLASIAKDRNAVLKELLKDQKSVRDTQIEMRTQLDMVLRQMAALGKFQVDLGAYHAKLRLIDKRIERLERPA